MTDMKTEIRDNKQHIINISKIDEPVHERGLSFDET
jgi:hypothetical protein